MNTTHRVRLLAGLAACLLLPSSLAAQPQQDRQWQHDDLRGDVYYQIFVRSFADSDGDGVGDFNGLRAKLDYLNDGDPSTHDDLGVDGIWLMPMFESPSYHGYNVVDYLSVDEEYGTLNEFRDFLQAAHERGLRVIVDFVMNHSSSRHPWFQASLFPESPYRDWYVWRGDDPGWKQPWGSGPTWHKSYLDDGTYFYGIFWSGMPDLNFAHPPVREEMIRLAKHWLAFGIDGFRLDATRHLFASGPGELQNGRPETHAFLTEFASAIRAEYPKAVLVGENWTDTEKIAPYFGSTEKIRGGDQLPMNFNFPLAGAVVDGLRDGTAEHAREVLVDMAELYPPGVIDAPFLRNHDQIRLATALESHPEKLRAAASVLLTLPGVPFLYYGEEIGQQNGSLERADELKRLPMVWHDREAGSGFTDGKPWLGFPPGRDTNNVADQTSDPASLLSYYRRWIDARKASTALRLGDLKTVDAGDGILAFTRSDGSETMLVLHNFTDKPQRFRVPVDRGPATEPWMTTAPIEADEGSWVLPPWASVVWPLTR